MNKISQILISLILIVGIKGAFAQDAVVASTPLEAVSLVTTNPWAGRAIGFYQGVETNRALSVSLYPSYAPGLKINGKSKPFGFGAAVLYPLSQHTFTGFRADYLAGDFFAAQAAVGAKADFQLWGHTFTGFAVTSVLLPIQGAGDSNFTPGNATGAGITTEVYKHHYTSEDLTVNLSYEGERWQVPGSVLDGLFVHHVAITVGITF